MNKLHVIADIQSVFVLTLHLYLQEWSTLLWILCNLK